MGAEPRRSDQTLLAEGEWKARWENRPPTQKEGLAPALLSSATAWCVELRRRWWPPVERHLPVSSHSKTSFCLWLEPVRTTTKQSCVVTRFKIEKTKPSCWNRFNMVQAGWTLPRKRWFDGESKNFTDVLIFIRWEDSRHVTQSKAASYYHPPHRLESGDSRDQFGWMRISTFR